MPGKFHGQRSLAGHSPQGCKESDTTEQLFLSFFIHKRRLLLELAHIVTEAKESHDLLSVGYRSQKTDGVIQSESSSLRAKVRWHKTESKREPPSPLPKSRRNWMPGVKQIG